MPRAIWSGSISFGLVNAPVRMYSAIDENDLELHLVHEKDGSPIGYEKVCKKEGKEVPADEIVKAYEVSDGELVYLEDEDFDAAEEEGYRDDPGPRLRPARRDRPDRLPAELLPRAGRRSRQGLPAPPARDGGVGALGNRRVRVPPEAAARLPAGARRRDRARGDVLRGRDPPGQGHRAETEREGRQEGARDGADAHRPLHRPTSTTASTRTSTASVC